MRKKTTSKFTKETEVDFLKQCMELCGISADERTVELIIDLHEFVKKERNKADIKGLCKVIAKHNKKHETKDQL